MNPEASGSGEVSRGRIAWLAFVVAVFGFHLWLEFRATGMHGVDGYYHVKLAHLYATGKLSFFGGDFPWMTCSSINDLRCDWQGGYHLLLVPFTWMGLLLGGKLSAALFAALIPCVVLWILRAHRVRFAWGIALLLCVASEYYLVRVHLPRPTSPVVVLLLLSAHFAATRRARAFFVTALAGQLLYCVPHNTLALAGVSVATLWLVDRAFPARIAAAAVGAVALGVLLNPGFWQWRGSFLGPDHALFNVWAQMSGSLRASIDGDRIQIDGQWVEMGAPAEFRPPSGAEVTGDFGVALALGLGAAAFLAFPQRRRDPILFVSVAMAALYFGLFLRHSRFAEYWIPFTVLALGLTASRALANAEASAVLRGAGRSLLAVLVAFAIVRAAWSIPSAATRMATDTGVGLEYEGAMDWLAAHTEPDEVVFHGRWPQFSPMFYFNDRNRYLIGLDPYFFYQHDPREYAVWVEASAGRLTPRETEDAIAGFGARFAFVRRNTPLDAVLDDGRRSLPVYEDGRFRVYEIGAD